MRSIRQPGHPHPERIIAIPAQGESLSIVLQPGISLLANMQRGFADAGFSGGVAQLPGVALAPFAYVMPALSKTGDNAAFYSDTFRPAGISRIENGAITVGKKNASPFFHCHAIWQEADGKRSGGHILPDETIVAEPSTVQAFGISGACFESHPDPETNFTLFGPMAAESTPAGKTLRKAYAIRLRPNQDFCQAIEGFCKLENIERARIYGGVGSTIGARFTNGATIDNFATEVFIRDGHIANNDGIHAATIDVGLVDYTGALAQGVLRRGENPVLMTFELVLVPE